MKAGFGAPYFLMNWSTRWRQNGNNVPGVRFAIPGSGDRSNSGSAVTFSAWIVGLLFLQSLDAELAIADIPVARIAIASLTRSLILDHPGAGS